MEEVTYKNREEMVYQVLKKEILDLELKPGQLIKETEICERFSVSRTPVRDALRLLQEQGFVITVPYRGIYVTLLSLSNIKQMIYMRVAVETMVIRDFSRIATPLMMEDIYYMLRKQKALIQTPDFKPEQFYRLDAQMHAIWFEATKKKKLWDLLQEQQLHYTRFRMLDFVTETDMADQPEWAKLDAVKGHRVHELTHAAWYLADGGILSMDKMLADAERALGL